MKVCAKCKKEMKCTKTGRWVIWRPSHVYAGDEFECPDCGALVVVTNSSSFHCEDAVKKQPNSIIMD